MEGYITGIQQCGIGVTDALVAAKYYDRLFGFNALVFDDTAEASLMTKYTGDKVFRRRAMLTMNMQGGGGLELWQFLDRKPQKAPSVYPGDLGINAIKIKCRNINLAHAYFQDQPLKESSNILLDSYGRKQFTLTDDFGNNFQLIEQDNFFAQGKQLNAGVCGAVIGVSDMEKSLAFYCFLLGIDKKGIEEKQVEENGKKFRKLILKKSSCCHGAFSRLLGGIELELVQALDRVPNKIFDNRFWGDQGFIHLCFDVIGMTGLKERSGNSGYPFTVDSNRFFEMENSGGRFCYVEDPDGTLIELVETHKVPILKKIGWHLNLQKRRTEKPLPDFMVKMLGFNKLPR